MVDERPGTGKENKPGNFPKDPQKTGDVGEKGGRTDRENIPGKQGGDMPHGGDRSGNE